MGGREESVTQMKLISRRQKQATHVHWQEVGAVATSYSYSLEQTGARNTHLDQTNEPNKTFNKKKKKKRGKKKKETQEKILR